MMIRWYDKESDQETKDIAELREILLSMDPLRLTIMREVRTLQLFNLNFEIFSMNKFTYNFFF